MTLFRVFLLGLGIGMAAIGGCELAAPRGRLVQAEPAPGTVIDSTTSAIKLRFSNPIANGSRATLSATYTLDAAGEPRYQPDIEFKVDRPDPEDPQALIIRLPGPLPAGLYSVQWHTVAARGNARRHGTVHYAVGTTIPDHILEDHRGGVYERNVRQRYTMATLAGGLVFMALAFLVGRRP